ncbi:MAG: EamA family transporter [Anaerolineae bacterium]|nr:EamA family transporter [Anaerolineae bacterium]
MAEIDHSGRVTAPPVTAAWQGVGLVVLATLCFSTAILFVRLIHGLDAMTITFYRSLFAFLFFCGLLPRFREPLAIARYRRYIPLLVGLGLAMALTASLYTYAVQHTTAANAALLNNSAPLYVALLAPPLLKEARPRYLWPGIALAALGVILITDPARLRLDPAAFGGIAAAALSGVTYAGPMLIGRALRGRVSSLTQIWWGAGLTALLLSPFGLRGDPATILNQLHLLIPLGVLSLGVPYLLMFLGLARVKAQVGSVAALMEPVFGTLIGFLFFAEVLTPIGMLGALGVLSAIVLISR